jgi:hypothetical protein
MTETHRVRELAAKVAALTGAEVAYLPNPRKEAPRTTSTSATTASSTSASSRRRSTTGCCAR